MSAAAMTAMQQGLQSCEGCGLLSRPAPGAEEGRCPRCDEELRFRKRDSLQRTLAFLIAAAICYVPANLLPVMTTITAGGEESDTIMQGVVLLWSPTGWPLSLIVLFASIMIPSAKILALLYLLLHRAARLDREQPAAGPALPDRGYHRPLVHGGCVRGHLYGGPHSASAAHVGEAGARGVILRGRRGADHARGRVLRPAADLGSCKFKKEIQYA